MDHQKLKDYLDFIEQYNDFLEEVIAAQDEKLEALLTHDAKIIEQSVVKQQTVMLQIQSKEETRIKLQGQAGFASKTMQQIVDSLEGEEKQKADRSLDRMQRLVEEIKFLNDKAMQMVETNLGVLKLMGADTPVSVNAYTVKGKQNDVVEQSPLFNSKI